MIYHTEDQNRQETDVDIVSKGETFSYKVIGFLVIGIAVFAILMSLIWNLGNANRKADALATQVEELTGQVTTLEEEKAALETELADTKKELTELKEAGTVTDEQMSQYSETLKEYEDFANSLGEIFGLGNNNAE